MLRETFVRLVAAMMGSPFSFGGSKPSFAGAVGWANSAPLSLDSLQGKVVLVDFWTYTCINSLRNLP